MPDADYVLPEGMTAEKLRTLAGWLDTYDRMAEVFWDLCERSSVRPPEELVKAREVTAGKEVQADLLAWSRDLDEKVQGKPPGGDVQEAHRLNTTACYLCSAPALDDSDYCREHHGIDTSTDQ